MLSSVSIVTITQLSRFKSLQICLETIKQQTYTNIIEWVIVEGSPTIEDAIQSKKNIFTIIDNNIPIKYIEFSGKKLGGLRNLGNDNCLGDIIICFDDDDYSLPIRIAHSVLMLQNNPTYFIGGVSDMYMYDFHFHHLFKFKYKIENHSTNNCMAYKKEYLLNNRYNEESICGEEKEFTCHFTNPMIAFHPLYTIIAISHNNNTFDKEELCADSLSRKIRYIQKVNCANITKFIPLEIFEKMKQIY